MTEPSPGTLMPVYLLLPKAAVMMDIQGQKAYIINGPPGPSKICALRSKEMPKQCSTPFFICFVAGIGAGLGTGFAGMSAAAVISPHAHHVPGSACLSGGGDRLGQRRARPARSALISITKTKTWTLKTAL